MKYKSKMPDRAEALEVQVLGKQFEWHFRYAGPDREFGTLDDLVSPYHLHVPTDRDVIVHLQTLDVLHSFWLPNVRLKQDLVPGMTIQQWFRVYKPGDYEVVCAELCGEGHTKMKADFHVHAPEDFDAWFAGEKAKYGEHRPEEDNNWKHWKTSPVPTSEEEGQ
jgi:cytochrome c oxidase subunit 2